MFKKKLDEPKIKHYLKGDLVIKESRRKGGPVSRSVVGNIKKHPNLKNLIKGEVCNVEKESKQESN